MGDLAEVGKSVTRIDALDKVTGKAKFTSDFKPPRMLFGKIVKSLYPHARILRIDTTQAESLPGVRTIVLPEDAPDMRFGHVMFDDYVLPRDHTVRCIDQPIAVVVADSPDIAEEAVDLVEVEYEELPAVFDLEEAFSEDAPAVVHPEMIDGFYSIMFPYVYDPKVPNCCNHFKIRHGDVEEGFREADIVLENKYTTARMAHSPLETQRVDAWVESDGTLTIRTSAQTPSSMKPGLAMLFGVPRAKLRILTPYVGGGFGGKVGNETLIAPLAILAAQKSGRPVRIENKREEDLISGRHRSDVVTYIKDGVKRDGTLVAREMRVLLNVGRASHVGHVITRNMAFGSVGTYRIPNFKWDSYGVYTNNPVTGAFRGFGSAEVNWAIEQQMNELALRLGIDPVEMRKKNLLREGDKDVCGQTTVAIGVEGCLDAVAAWIEEDGKPVRVEGPWRKGKGIAVGNKYTVSMPSMATVKVHSDGGIEVRHGSVEIGQGLNTVLAQIAAEEFAIPPHQVRVVCGDTALCPPDHGAVSSRSTFFTGNAVRLACLDAKDRVCKLAAARLGGSADSLDIGNGRVFVKSDPDKSLPIGDLFWAEGVPLAGGEVIGTATFFVPMMPVDPETGQSERIVSFYSYFAHAAEVAVNVETGEVKVLRIAAAGDMGTPINPEMIKVQLEGALLQGIGSSLYEQIVLENGVVINPNFADYKLPTTREMVPQENVKVFLSPVPHPEGPFGAKGAGEGPLVSVAPAIGNAVYNAVGVRIRDLPIMREKILAALEQTGES